MHSSSDPSNEHHVPAFLAKLWKLVNDSETDKLIHWREDGKSFVIQNPSEFSRDVLPLYFKHNNLSSFIRQLNMYGFHKVSSIDAGTLKPDREELEFRHEHFLKDAPFFLELIKRKISLSREEGRISQEVVGKVLDDVHSIRSKQESFDSQLAAMKRENEALWRELAIVRQKHAKQQQMVDRLIKFLVYMMPSNRQMTAKRKLPLMLDQTAHEVIAPKLARAPQTGLKQANGGEGPVIYDVTDLLEEERKLLDSLSVPPVASTSANLSAPPVASTSTADISVPYDTDQMFPLDLGLDAITTTTAASSSISSSPGFTTTSPQSQTPPPPPASPFYLPESTPLESILPEVIVSSGSDSLQTPQVSSSTVPFFVSSGNDGGSTFSTSGNSAGRLLVDDVLQEQLDKDKRMMIDSVTGAPLVASTPSVNVLSGEFGTSMVPSEAANRNSMALLRMNSREDYDSHVEGVQLDIDAIRELLSQSQDPFFHELFSEQEMPTHLPNLKVEQVDTTDEDKQLMQYDDPLAQQDPSLLQGNGFFQDVYTSEGLPVSTTTSQPPVDSYLKLGKVGKGKQGRKSSKKQPR